MSERYLVECEQHPCTEWGTNNWKFKNAQVIKLNKNQQVIFEPEIEAREYNARRNGLQDGRNEAWELARKIAGTVANGSYNWPTLRRIFGKDWSMMEIFDDNYETIKKKISDYQNRPKVGDMVCVHSGNNHYDGRLALVVAIRESKNEGKLEPLLKVVFDDGDVSLYTRDAVDYIRTVGFDKFFSEKEEEEENDD